MENSKENRPVIKHLNIQDEHTAEKDIDVIQILDDERRRVIGLSIRGGSVLKRHHADYPITVYCLSGVCRFKSGSRLEEVNEMKPGTLLALDAGIEHEVEAAVDTRLLVSKFK